MCCMCNKCGKMMGLLVLVIGILFLLRDVGGWNFWGLQWYTIAFILAGGAFLGSGCCKDCKAMCETKTKKK